jgi:steroid 5-alpha reductase family enzyme
MSTAPAASPVPGDEHLLLLSLAVTVALQLLCFAVAWTLQVDLLTDAAGSSNFILLALLSHALGQGFGAAGLGAGGAVSRAQLLTALVCVARLELLAYLQYRVLKRGHDSRFDAMRAQPLPFFGFWVGQMLWAFVVSLPVVFVNADVPAAAAPPLFGGEGRAAACDAAGLAMFVAGFALQVAADLQKDRFRSDRANRARVCDVGVWRYSRHPNFFGEIFMWWGAFVLALPACDASAARWGYAACAASPLLTMLLLLFLSGMPTAEGNNQLRFMRSPEDRARYEAYRWRTSPLLPLPNALYAATPLAVKRWLLFELSMYEVSDEAATALSRPLSDVGGAGGAAAAAGGGEGGEGGSGKAAAVADYR